MKSPLPLKEIFLNNYTIDKCKVDPACPINRNIEYCIINKILVHGTNKTIFHIVYAAKNLNSDAVIAFIIFSSYSVSTEINLCHLRKYY